MKRATAVIVSAVGLLGLGQPARLPAAILVAPQDFSAVRAYPNPWRSDQHGAYPVRFDPLPQGTISTVRIFTIAGELVRTLTGTQSIPWDLCNDSGQRVASGIYLYLLTGNNQQKTGKIMVIR